MTSSSIQAATEWPFHIHGIDYELFEELEEESFIDEETYQLMQLTKEFYLEPFHLLLRNFRNARWESRGKLPEAMLSDLERNSGNTNIELPEAILETYSLYRNSGWAYPYPFRVTMNEHDILGIRVTTDGSHGVLEIFNVQGERLASAYTRSGTGIAWRSLNPIIPEPPADDPPLDPPEYYPPICPSELEVEEHR